LHWEGLAEWKAEIGDCVQDLCNEALLTNEAVACFFSRRAWNVGECAEWIINTLASISNCILGQTTLG